MKVNKKFIRSITSICAVVLCLSLFVFSVSAESTGAEFFDFDQYATYEEFPETDEVKATITLPDSWYISYLNNMNLPPVYGPSPGFEVQGKFGSFSVSTSPFGSLWNYDNIVGSNTHILDLSLMPKDFILTGGFVFEYYGEFNFEPEFSPVNVLGYDEYGRIVDVIQADDYLSIYENSNGYVRGEYEFVFESSNLQYLIGDIKGITFQFELGSFLNAGADDVGFDIYMNPFEMKFWITNAFINNRNDRIIRDKLSNLEKQLGDIDNKFDSVINGTPEQNQQAQDAVGGLNSSTDKLGQLGDTMASVDKPTIDSNKISAGSLVPQTSLVVLSSPFQALWENKQLLAMLTIVVTLVLVSWVFFGKKA